MYSEFLCWQLHLGGSNDWICIDAGGRHVYRAKQQVLQISQHIIFSITALEIHVLFHTMVL
jgi:hypothetical protein